MKKKKDLQICRDVFRLKVGGVLKATQAQEEHMSSFLLLIQADLAVIGHC